jgi:hypothetical protein
MVSISLPVWKTAHMMVVTVQGAPRDLILKKSCREENVFLSFFSRHGFWRGDLIFTRPLWRETIFPEQTSFFCCRMKSILFYLADVARGKFFLEQANGF